MNSVNLLLTPGPVPIPEPVRDLLSEPIFHHRTPRFREILSSVSTRLKQVFRTASPVYTLAGSGTSAMEAAVVNFHAAGDEVLVVDTGKFGERFAELALAYGLKPVIIKTPWGRAAEAEEIRRQLTAHPGIRSVFVQLCETSTGVVNDIEAIGKVVRGTSALLIVDAIAGLAADRLETDAWGVDVVAAGSQKALMLPPGLAFISVGPKAQERMQKPGLPRYYLDLRRYEKALAQGDTPYTPATMLVYAADKVLELVLAERLENIWWRTRQMAEYARRRLTELGFEVFAKSPSSALTAALVPAGVDGRRLLTHLREEKGITIAGGQDAYKGRLIRMAHMGSITIHDLDEGFRALEETLSELRGGHMASLQLS